MGDMQFNRDFASDMSEITVLSVFPFQINRTVVLP